MPLCKVISLDCLFDARLWCKLLCKSIIHETYLLHFTEIAHKIYVFPNFYFKVLTLVSSLMYNQNGLYNMIIPRSSSLIDL